MKTITMSLTFICFYLTSFSQTWLPLNSGTSNHLLGISVVDANTVYACGVAGEILKTTDGGINWISQTSGTIKNLYAICFTDVMNGVAVGDTGTCLRTTDGGITWNDLSISSNISFRNVYFLDPNIGYRVGGTAAGVGYIYKTIDGGATWTPQTTPATQGIYGIKFTSLTDGFASNSQGTVFRTVDGGTSWNPVSSGTSNIISDLFFLDPANGFGVGGNGIIRYTNDNGSTWNPIQSNTTDYLTGISFMDPSKGFIVGGTVSNNTGRILSTVDGGITWNNVPINSSRLYRLGFANTTGYTVGLDGTILKYTASSAITENTNSNELNVYPNPANGYLYISSPKESAADIEVYDMQGKVIYHSNVEEIHENATISTSSLTDGVYLLKVICKEKIYTARFLKSGKQQ